MSIQKIIQESINKSPRDLKEALEEELRSRIAIALEAKMADKESEDDEEDEELDEKKLSDKDINRALASAKAKPKETVSLKKPTFKMEEAEQIDELSKDIVRNYYNKAGEQGRDITGKMMVGGGDWSKDGKDTETLKKRAAGREMALKRRRGEVKMSEEAEQIDELKKSTLASYTRKAASSMGNAAYDLAKKQSDADEVDRMTNRHMPDKYNVRDQMKKSLGADDEAQGKDRNTIGKRMAGIKQATDKLSKD